MAGDGMPRVGHFWSHALGWPLVWDQDQQTAIQSSRGGTKLSWGGPPVRAKRGRNRLRWVLATDRPAAEIERLVGLGARLLHHHPDRAELADPEDNEFTLTIAR